MPSLRLLALLAFVLTTTTLARAAEVLVHRTWTIDGVTREALIYTPAKAKTEATPVVFAFHGHGGSAQQASRNFGYHTVWPEAVVVYMQGLDTPGQLTDPAGDKAGWQAKTNDEGNRDLKFFDAVLATLRQELRVDDKRLYATGHSIGGGFTYLLWAARGDKFAAFAPSAAVASRGSVPLLKPKPVLHVAGEKDPLVKFAWQQQMMAAVRRIDQCTEGQPWTEGIKGCTLYPSKVGAPVVTYIHPGTHTFPSEAPALIVKFFKEHALP